jgi:hypothetical protein
MAEESIQFTNEYISEYNISVSQGYSKYNAFTRAAAIAAYAMETRIQNNLIY